MSAPVQAQCANRLLALMSREDFERLAPDLSFAELKRSHVVVELDGEIIDMVFPETSITSIIATSPEGQECEAGIFGRDGVGPLPALLGSTTSVNRMEIQVPGTAYSIPRAALVHAMATSASLRDLLLRYVQAMNTQTSFTALSNAVHQIDERLARWLLMCHDRSPSDEVPLTHEFLSLMLAVRRPSVTTALHVLEANRFIRNDRGWIVIRDRKGLEEFAADAYGKPEAEYRRLIGPLTP